jgi:hypothetical protein
MQIIFLSITWAQLEKIVLYVCVETQHKMNNFHSDMDL